jgi:acetyltransferase-like isoleucine patch superfamily enzyme
MTVKSFAIGVGDNEVRENIHKELIHYSLAPVAVTGGNVKIGFRSTISMGASVKHGVSIGDDSVLGANSYLNNDLENNQVAYDVSAKK